MRSAQASAVGPRSRLPSSVLLLVGAGFLIAMGYGIITPALPIYARSFGVGITATTVVVSAFAVVRVAFAPASGTLVRRCGLLWVFCGGLLIVALSSVACAFAATFAQLLTFRALGGIGSTMFTVSAAALLIRISPSTMRGRAAGAWATGSLLGGIAGPVIGGALSGLGPRAPFLAYAATLGVVVAVAATMLNASEDRVPTEQHSALAPSVLATLRHPTFRAALAANFVNGWTVYGVRIALVPLLIVDHLGMSGQWSAAALAGFAIGTAATSSLGGRLADLYGRRPLVLSGLAIVALSMCWLGLSSSPTEIVAAALVSGMGTGVTAPPTNAAVADVVAGRHAGPALAAYQMVGDVGAIIGPVAAGLIADRAGYPAAFVLTAAVVAVAAAGWLRVPETLAPADSRPAAADLSR